MTPTDRLDEVVASLRSTLPRNADAMTLCVMVEWQRDKITALEAKLNKPKFDRKKWMRGYQARRRARIKQEQSASAA